MSEDSPYTFHAVGAEGEPTHYELRDVSGRVVCKAFVDAISVWGQETRFYGTFSSLEILEATMRAEISSYE